MVNIDNIFKIISEKGITQSKLAEDTSISTGNISDWKKGRSMPSAIKLDELATYFNCSVDYLLGRTDEPTVNTNITGNTQNNINGSNNIGTSSASTDSISEKFMQIFSNLSFEEQMEVMSLALEKSKK